MAENYPTKATVLVRRGPKGTPWEHWSEHFDHGQETDLPVEFRSQPVEEQLAEQVRELAKRRSWAVLIVWE
jgi:hypothetical protein